MTAVALMGNDQRFQLIHFINWICLNIPNEMFNDSTVDWTKDFHAQLIKVTFSLSVNSVCTNTWSKTVYCYCSDFFKALQWSCLPKDPMCAARSNHKVQYDVWQVWASESKTNIFLYLWFSKVFQEKIAFLQRVLELKKYLVSFASILLDYVMGLVVRSCSRIMEKFSRNVGLPL